MNELKNFLLNKFPTNEYEDCPVLKDHWEIIQEYADKQSMERDIEIEYLKKEIEKLNAWKESAMKVMNGLEDEIIDQIK